MTFQNDKWLLWCACLLFAAVLLLVFGNFCVLRVFDSIHVYKEYLSGIAVLALFFSNIFLLFPLLYEKGRPSLYFLWSALSVVAAFLVEMLLVVPDVFPDMAARFSFRAALSYMITDGIYVFLRDCAFVAFAFALKAAHYYRRLHKEMESFLMEESRRIEVVKNDKSGLRITVPVSSIAYCEHHQNYTYAHLVDGSSAYRYGSFKDIMGLLCPKYAVRISRNILVVYENICSYNSTGAVVRSEPENVLLSFSQSFQREATLMIGEHVGEKKRNSRPKPQTRRKKRKDGTGESLKTQSYKKDVYAYIQEHPGASAGDIKKNRNVSQSTVNRILGQLKKEGLIEYRGSKRKGGYFAVEKGEEGELEVKS